MALKIKNVELKTNFILSPMAGITNEAYRMLAMEYGAGMTVCEMVSDKALYYKNEKTFNMTKVNEKEHPVSLQIFGHDIDTMVKAAIFVDKNSEADIIDINMGCPVNKVCKTGAGSSLMKDEDYAYKLLKEIVSNVKKPVTLKVRLGWDKDNINVLNIAKIAEKAGISAITVHARTRSEFYQGHSHWEYIKLVKDNVNIPVIGNGDVNTIEDAIAMFKETGCDAIAIGRGAIGNPFLFKQLNAYFEEGKYIEKPSNEELFNTICHHYDMLKKLKGTHLALLEMRTFIPYYIKGMQGSSKIKDQCNKALDFDLVLNILKDFLNIK